MSKYYVDIYSEKDINIALNYVSKVVDDLAFSEMDKQKVLVSVAELTRNILDHTNSKGYFCCEGIFNEAIRIEIVDHGDGIEELENVLSGKEYIGKGLGLGLAGSKKLMDDFTIESSKGGTKIVAVKWKTGRRRKEKRTHN
ncbi:ATP-binding protein [Halalkalibacter urbisdiaboli]|uniref:ATP-binding protein n=1 Tax=Halalkalibacter urbisdiaboli TaxID=1960589 RepID=UPI000B454CA6|nr:ATP-binding protein [Halalkalibacter urbisdiaboli]